MSLTLTADWPIFFALLLPGLAVAQSQSLPEGTHVDESKVPQYTLPDPLVMAAGTPVDSPEAWREARRPEILELFREHVYGRAPTRPATVRAEVRETTSDVLGGLAERRQVRIWLGPEAEGPAMDLLIYAPRASGPVPAFLALNFNGNHTVHEDPAIFLPESWVPNDEADGVTDNRASERSRGAQQSRWAIEAILKRGYAVATVYYGDIDPDFDDGFRNGVHGLFRDAAQDTWEPDAWGSVAGWAWGLSRVLDYLETGGPIDASRVALMGHSRLGKTALWAGAQDERFAMVISNNSGCGGAALSRRGFGETVAFINGYFPHWFADNFATYGGREDALPVDQHMLIALIAPRPVYVASAAEDLWADPRGEFLGAKHASPVYGLLGEAGLGDAEMPAPGEPLVTSVGYHVRPGPHDVTAYDWEQYLAFADRHLGGE